MAGVLPVLLAGQTEGRKLAFHAELRQEDWTPTGARTEQLVKVTRLQDGSSLTIFQFTQPEWRAGKEYFILIDRSARMYYSGDSITKAAFRFRFKDDEKVADGLGDCSFLSDGSIPKVRAGQIRKFEVFRTETTDRNERLVQWISPELHCLALRSQLLVDEFVRERREATELLVLTAETTLELPKGTKVVPPLQYCQMFKENHRGEEALPERACQAYQQRYLQMDPTGPNR